MPKVTPSQIINGYTVLATGVAAPSQGIFIPLASYPSLSSTEVDAAYGDGSKFIHEIVKVAVTKLADIAPNSRPTKFSVTRGTPAGVNATTVRQSYTITFDLDISGSDVASE